MNRAHRFVPWLIVLVFAAVLAMGATWDAAFEGLPPNSEAVSQGASRIRDLKVEVRDRSEEEHCFGTVATGCSTTDSGFHRTGSGRAFYGNAAPTNFFNPAGTALGVNNTAGRMWVDPDGPDGSFPSYDDYTFSVWDSGVLNWNIVHALQPTITNSATADNDQTFAASTVFGTPADIVLSGGASGGNPSITTPAAGTWDIVVAGTFAGSIDSVSVTTDTNFVVRLQEQIGAGAFAAVAWCAIRAPQTNNGGNAADMGTCTFDYVRRAATVSTAYTYRLRIASTVSSSTVLRIDSTQAGDQIETEAPDDGFLTVEAVRR